jgi:hypothetical protein
MDNPEQRVQRLRDWMVEQEASTNSSVFGLKHPLLSLSAPDVLAAWGNETTFVWAHRPLAESIAGLNRRGWFDATPGALDANELRADLQTKLWRSLRAFFQCGPESDGGTGPGAAATDAAGCRAHRTLVVSYAELLRDAPGAVRRIAGALGLDPTEAALARAVSMVTYQ